MNRGYRTAAALLILSALACNAPRRPPAAPEPDGTPVTAANAPMPAETPAAPTASLPDIAGTVNARASATPDASREGILTGALRYPSEGNPPMRVYALSTGGGQYRYVEVGGGRSAYTLEVPPGEYFVLADLGPEVPGFEGGYTVHGQCLADKGLDSAECAFVDFGLVAVRVGAGQTITGIDLIDWFPPEGTFPAVPD